MSRFWLDCCSVPDADAGGWYALRGGSNWASVEGAASEWLAVARYVENANDVVAGPRFARLAAVCHDNLGYVTFRFWSPRNAVGLGDVVDAGPREARELAAEIRRVIAAAGERCVGGAGGGFDPVLMGM